MTYSGNYEADLEDKWRETAARAAEALAAQIDEEWSHLGTYPIYGGAQVWCVYVAFLLGQDSRWDLALEEVVRLMLERDDLSYPS